MKYILDEHEMLEVKNLKAIVKKLPSVQALQSFCTMVANELPITVAWRRSEAPEPWRCVLTEQDEWYCDECPARHVCPNQYKSWSK